MTRSISAWGTASRLHALTNTLLPLGTGRRQLARQILTSVVRPTLNLLRLVMRSLPRYRHPRRTCISATRGQLSGAGTPTQGARPGEADSSESRQSYFNFIFEMNRSRSSEYVPISYPDVERTGVRLIAFYLPQFHPIPENDQWWGKGFTDWTNVAKAVPQFIGHYQPRLPGELGFYDLRIPEVQERQVELAKQYGVCGFCFHFYWFNGKTLLERPLEQFVSNSRIDLPFCVSWANENWTRRWDGLDDDMLIEQAYSPDDDLAFIKHISKYFKDRRYIRIDSRPLLIVYKPALLPNPRRTAARWRDWCRADGLGEIYLALTEAFHHIDPRQIGFDAAIEFPGAFSPHLTDVTVRFDVVNSGYHGKILDYNSAVDAARDYKPPAYKKFRGLCPGWDNEARREGRGLVLANSSPKAYGDWLQIVCDFTIRTFHGDERIVFVNAWNEWAEGAYLEPDRRYGYAYLAKTAEVLSSFPEEPAAPPRKGV